MSFFKRTVITPPAPGTKTWGFRLGDEVKDKINGLTGIALSRIYHVTGCDTFIVELPADGGKRGDSINISGERLELVTSHPDRHIDEIPEEDLCLGDKVECLATGIKGTVTLLEVPLYGTTRCCIEPGYNEREKKVGEGWMTDTNVVSIIKPLKAPEATDAPAPTKPKRDGASRLPRNF